MICIKFDQKIEQHEFWTFEVLKFFKSENNLGFSKPFSSRGITSVSPCFQCVSNDSSKQWRRHDDESEVWGKFSLLCQCQCQ